MPFNLGRENWCLWKRFTGATCVFRNALSEAGRSIYRCGTICYFVSFVVQVESIIFAGREGVAKWQTSSVLP